MAEVPLLRIRGLTKAFGGLVALRKLDLDVHLGQVLSIIGPNGSGKTTFFNLISGLYRPTEGTIRLMGQGGCEVELVGLKPHEITLRGVARTFQNLRLFPEMSVLENVMVGMHGKSREGLVAAICQTRAFLQEEERIRARAEVLLSFFGERLLPLRDEAARNLSYANQRRLEIVRAMASEPRLLLLDEPAAGMNPTEKAELMEDIHRLKAMNCSIVLIEHDMMVVRHVSDRVLALDHGERIAEGDFEMVRCNPDVIEAYLGKGAAVDARDA